MYASNVRLAAHIIPPMPFDPESLPVPDLGLRCLACQYQLTGLMVHRCPECGRAFTLEEHIPPGDWPIMIVDGQGVPATSDAIALLKAAKVPIFPFSSADTAPHGMSRHYGGTPDIRVARIAYWDAVHLITRHQRGEPIDLPPPAGDVEWTCAGCGEANPANFEVCWQCDGDRPS